jgi:hypothetical protein
VLDLVMHFSGGDVRDILPDGVGGGDVLTLRLTGNLKPEFGSTPIRGEDVIVIVPRR